MRLHAVERVRGSDDGLLRTRRSRHGPRQSSHTAAVGDAPPGAQWPTNAPTSRPSAAQFSSRRRAAGSTRATCGRCPTTRRCGSSGRPRRGADRRAAGARGGRGRRRRGGAAPLRGARVVQRRGGSAVHQNFALGDAAAPRLRPAPPAAPQALRGVQSLAEGARLHVWLAVVRLPRVGTDLVVSISRPVADAAAEGWRRPRTSSCSAPSSPRWRCATGACLAAAPPRTARRRRLRVFRRSTHLYSETARKFTASRRTRGRRSGSRSTGG